MATPVFATSRQSDGSYIVIDTANSNVKVAGPFDGPPNGGLTLAQDMVNNLNSVIKTQVLTDAVPTVAAASFVGPHG